MTLDLVTQRKFARLLALVTGAIDKLAISRTVGRKVLTPADLTILEDHLREVRDIGNDLLEEAGTGW